MKGISVIIPVYNAEKTLSRCLDSVLSQIVMPVEIVCVNDGSTDSSQTMLQAYQEKHSCIRIIPQKNQGVSAARNAGIDEAKGDWLLFLDADDYLEPTAIETLAADATVEISLAGLTIHTVKKTYKQNLFRKEIAPKTGSLTIKEALEILTYYTFCGPVCKLFRTDIIMQNNIRFPLDMQFGEDTVFVYTYLKYVNRLMVHNIHPYHCDKGNECSLTATVNSTTYYDSMSRIYPIMRETHVKHHAAMDYADYIYLDTLQTATQMSYSDHGLTPHERIKIYQTIFTNKNKHVVISQCSPIVRILGQLHAWHLCDLYLKIRNKQT